MRDVLPIELHDHDPVWVERFVALRDEALEAARRIGIDGLQVHHVGSTSVPGLAAKPTIDLLVVCASLEDADALAAALDAGAWRYRHEHEAFLPARRFCQLEDEFGRRVANLHTFVAGDPAIDRHLAFPAQLRRRDEARAAYESRKRELAAVYVDDVNAYAAAKTMLIREIEAAGLPRAIEGSVVAHPDATAGIHDPATWWFSHSDLASDGQVAYVIEEEYGYRRRIITTPDSDALDVLRIEREWDGAPGGPSRTMDVDSVAGSRIEVWRAENGVVSVAWTGIAPDALDVARREGEALLHALTGLADAGAPARGVEVELACDAQVAWNTLFDPDAGPAIVGSHDAWLRADPGRAWSVGTPSGTVSGRVLVAVAGRRLVLSMRDARAAGGRADLVRPLLVDIGFERSGGGARCSATISGAAAGDADLLDGAAELVGAMLGRLADAARERTGD